MKICSSCKLPKDNFYTNNARFDKLQSACIDCSRNRSKDRYNKFSDAQKQEIKDRTRQNILINRQFVWDYLKEHSCVDCGEKDPVVLEFDHLSNKIATISKMVGQGLSLETIKEEISKCEVRCANCHRKKTAKDFGWYKSIVP